jgi:hypothetical protein
VGGLDIVLFVRQEQVRAVEWIQEGHSRFYILDSSFSILDILTANRNQHIANYRISTITFNKMLYF